VTAVLIAIAVVIVLAVVVAVLRARRSRHSDGVATFRRQIDALSPEARRPVIDRVQQLEDEAAESPERKPGDES
jgi:HAMP domain-containing protein